MVSFLMSLGSLCYTETRIRNFEARLHTIESVEPTVVTQLTLDDPPLTAEQQLKMLQDLATDDVTPRMRACANYPTP